MRKSRVQQNETRPVMALNAPNSMEMDPNRLRCSRQHYFGEEGGFLDPTTYTVLVIFSFVRRSMWLPYPSQTASWTKTEYTIPFN